MIEFKKIRFKNILSYGNNFTEIDFEKNSMTLISGKNGSGKTCAGDALVFSLFGVPFRNINKPNLVNSINGKDCLVEVEFVVGKTAYKVRRGIKPTIFEIYSNGKLVDQDSKSKDYQKYLEQNILKMNYKSFTQLVFLGSSSFTPFMQLTAADRREVIEELLDIRVFSRMNSVLKTKIALVKENLKDSDRSLMLAKERLESHKEYLRKIGERSQELIDGNLAEISKNQQSLAQTQSEISNIEQQIVVLQNQIADYTTVLGKMQTFKDCKKKIEEQSVKLTKTIDFYEHTSECPTCKQSIGEDFKTQTIAEKTQKGVEMQSAVEDLTGKISRLQVTLDSYNKIQNQISVLAFEVQNKKSHANSVEKYVSKLKADNQKLQAASEKDASDDAKTKLLEDNFLAEQKKKDEFVELKHLYDISGDLLKDSGIKTKIIKQYLPVMNKLINKYLSSMDFFVNFNLDENFKEVIKSRHRDEFEYHSFSEGEKFRIDVALLLTWREISRKKNSTNTNILFLDEIFDGSLDNTGTDDFMKLLKTLSKKIHIFCVSHKPDVIGDRFDAHLKIEKKNGFSVIRT